MTEPEDDLAAARGCLNGLVVVALVYAIVFLIWALTAR